MKADFVSIIFSVFRNELSVENSLMLKIKRQLVFTMSRD